MATDESPAKKSEGRKKIEIRLIKKKSNRLVTFSKRRASLFRKASELATLCGAHVAIMIFSPGGKIYSFGHPSVEAVIERYESYAHEGIRASRPSNVDGAEFMRLAAYRAEKTLRLKMELQRTLDDIEAKKNKVKMLDMAWEKEHAKYWWNAPVEKMNMACCKALMKMIMDLKINVEAEMKRRNQLQEAKKDLITQAIPGKVIAPSVGDPEPNNFVAGWINSAAHSHKYMPGPSNAAAASASSPIANFQGIGFYNFGGGTSTSASLPRSSSSTTVGTRIVHGHGLNSSGVGPNHTYFNNFPF